VKTAWLPAEPDTVVSPELRVGEAASSDRDRWDAFVRRQAGASGYHEWAWREIFERSFGHRTVYLAAWRDDRIDGVLPIVDMRSLIFGRFLTSLPFVNYGGVLASSDEARRALVGAARDLACSRGCRHLELRHAGRRVPDAPVRQHKVAMRLPLAPNLWERFDRKVRNQVRKAEKSDLTVESGGANLLPEFYGVFARNMRDLGTPVYSRTFFREVLRAFPDRARVIVVRQQTKPVAAGIAYRTGSTVEMPWASSLREFNPLCPNHLLYWHAIETAIADGCDTFDFGRSTPGGGTFKFKEQWGAEPVPLHWEYPYLANGALPDQGPTNPKFQAAIALWQKCPLWLANTVGPFVVRGIP
jgi:FemAB-related protein (PEP-CTERM system-associated)